MARKVASPIVDLGVFSTSGIVDRRARLYVPSRVCEKRPLVVMLDGQNVFGEEGSFAGGWHADDTADKMRAAPAILAIDHGGKERIEELAAPRSGKLGVFLELVTSRIIPAARERVRVDHEPTRTIIVGSSLGGLAALFIHFRRSDVFGGAVCMSPSFWLDRRAIFGFIDSQPNPPASRVWLDAGGKEAGGRLVPVVEAMGAKLRGRGLRVHVQIDPRGTHQESAWRRRLPKALRFVLA